MSQSNTGIGEDAGSQPSSSSRGRNFMRTVDAGHLQALTSSQKGIITTIRSVQEDETISIDNLKRTIADMYPPAALFAKELRDLPALYSELRDLLDSRGANMTQHSSRRVMMTLATKLYEESEDTLAATEIVQEVIAAGRRRQPENTTTRVQSRGATASNNNTSTDVSAEKVAHNVAMRLRDNEKKFSGDLGENWMEFVDEYTQIARDYHLGPGQKLQYLHNILRGDAKRYYLDTVDGYASNYQQAIDMIDKEYNSSVRQTRVKNYLNSLRLSTFETKGIETSAALSQVYKIIIKFSRQAPKSHQGDAHKIEFLRNAVVGYPWSHEPLSRVPTHDLSFQGLYGELEAALQLHKEGKLAVLRDKAQTGARSISGDSSSIFYQGQGRYLNNVTTWRKGKSNNSTSKRQKPFNPLSIQGCFNCDSPDHMVKQCPRPLNVAKAATRKIDYYAKKDKGRTHAVHMVLADLCLQLDNFSVSEEGENGDHSDVDVFQSLLIGDRDEGANEPEVIEPSEADNTIYFINYEHVNIYEDTFLGACIDSAAQKTVIGKPQAEVYTQSHGLPFRLEPSKIRPNFSFGTHRHPGLGKMEIRVPVSGDYYLPLKVEVVNIDIPFLIGLDSMKEYGMVLDTDRETLSSNYDGWQVPLVYKRGHLYYEWEMRILFTEAELRKVHKHFFHPKPEKLYALIRRADPSTASPQVLRDLETIDATCDPCQRFGTSPHRFKVSLPSGDIIFNREVCVDLMTLSHRQVLHAVDRDTKFNVARFLENETAKTAWDTFREMWVLTYVGYPDIVSADQGPQFRSKHWRDTSKLTGIDLKLSGVESHNALNVGETYHEFLRRIFNKAKRDNPELSDEDLLVLSTKALNDTAGPNGLVPTLLVFGILPRIPFVPTELPTQVQRMKAMDEARAEMSALVAKSKLKVALKTNAPGAASSFEDIKIGSKVLVFREKPIKEWVGPFTVLDVDGKICQLNVNGRQSKYSIDKVKLYRRPKLAGEALEETQASSNQWSPEDFVQHPKVQSGVESHALPEHAMPSDPENPLNDSDVVDKWRDTFADIQDKELQEDVQELQDLRLNGSLPNEFLADDTVGIHITKVLSPNDSQGDGPEFDTAKNEEAAGIKRRDIWDIVKRDDVPRDANILGGRFVLAFKNYGTPNETMKARYVAQGHKDKEKGFVVHNVTTLHVSSTRILISVAAVKGFKIYADDVRQAYLQNEHQLTRKIYILPKGKDRKFFDVAEDEMLQLKKPIYGVTDAGDYWDVTIHDHVKKYLKLVPLVGDPALYMKSNEVDVDGLMAVYVDDKAMTGNEKMQELTQKTAKRFDSKPREWDDFNSFGMHMKTLVDGVFAIEQLEYIRKLKPIPMDCSFEYFRSYRAVFAWISLTRPDIACVLNRGAQVTESTFSAEKIRELNKGIARVKGTEGRHLMYRPLRKETMHLRVYSDSSFANNDDLSTQMGFIVLLCDHTDACHFLEYSSKKCKRIVRSVLGEQIYALAEAFDKAYMLKRDLESIYKMIIPLHMLTDSRSMFDVLTKSSSTSEKRLMIDLRALQEAYQREEISHVGLILSQHNIADGMTKIKPNSSLEGIMDTGFDKTPIEQWVFRTKASSS